jgi:peptidoglycan/xylan/chitin deacetylase (PgdA/CDA1 family)
MIAALGLAPWIQRPFLFEVGFGAWPLFRRPGRTRNVYLTFDDGPHPRNTPHLLDVLDHVNVVASFFVVTEYARKHPSLTREILERGHTLGSHGYSHRHLFLRDSATLRREVVRAVDDLEQIVNRTISFFRPPYGVRTPELYRVLQQQGLRPIFWDVITYDWRNPSPHQIAVRAAKAARPGSIILLHDGGGSRPSTITAVPELVERLRAQSLSVAGLATQTETSDQGKPIAG